MKTPSSAEDDPGQLKKRNKRLSAPTVILIIYVILMIVLVMDHT